jgi:single-stranded DNA-binding protein
MRLGDRDRTPDRQLPGVQRMIHVLIAGRLFGRPQSRASKSGNDFVTGKMRVSAGEETLFCNFIAFRAHLCEQLLALDDGASISIAGELKISMYISKKDGSHRPSLDVTVHELLTPAHVARRRKAMSKDADHESEQKTSSAQAPARAAAGQEDFNDEIPF